MFRKIILVYCFLIFISGCAILEHKDQLLTLKSLGDDQDRQKKFIERQEKNFKLLLSDIEKGALKKGTTRRQILSRFGEPISIKEIGDDPMFLEQFTYRHPEQFFGSEKVYLFFDKNQALAEWLYEPAPKE